MLYPKGGDGGGLWEAAACSDMELVMMMPGDKKRLAQADVEAPFSFMELLPSGFQKPGRALAYISFYLLTGPGLIMMNRHIVKDVGFHFPLTLALWSQLMGSLLTLGTVHFQCTEMPNASKKMNLQFFLREVLPIGVMMALKMMFSMSSYLYVSVSFMQIMKSFSPAIVLLVLAASGVERPTAKSSASVLVMCIGILITATGEVNFSLPGFTLLLLGQICEAIRLVMMQRFITRLNFKAIELQYYRAPAAAGTLLIFAVFMESGSIWRSSGYELFVQHVHIFVFQSILGLCVNISKILVLKVTNSVTLKVITVVRNAALVFINMAFFGEVVTSRQVAGYGLLLAAFSVFQYFRWEQASAARAKASV